MIVKGKLITCKREVKTFGGKEQKEKLRAFESSLSDKQSAKKKSFSEKLKDVFNDLGDNNR